MRVYIDGIVSEEIYMDFCVGSPPIKLVSSLLQKVNTIQHIVKMNHLWCPEEQLFIKSTRSLVVHWRVVMEAGRGLEGER